MRSNTIPVEGIYLSGLILLLGFIATGCSKSSSSRPAPGPIIHANTWTIETTVSNESQEDQEMRVRYQSNGSDQTSPTYTIYAGDLDVLLGPVTLVSENSVVYWDIQWNQNWTSVNSQTVNEGPDSIDCNMSWDENGVLTNADGQILFNPNPTGNTWMIMTVIVNYTGDDHKGKIEYYYEDKFISKVINIPGDTAIQPVHFEADEFSTVKWIKTSMGGETYSEYFGKGLNAATYQWDWHN